MASRIIDVFLSSTALDLERHRAAVHAELVSTGLFRCVRQEDFGAQNVAAVEYCREKVKASDIFIGLTGQRRGWEPDGDNAKRSITEMEHDWAKDAGSRRYLYVTPDNFPVPGNLRDTDEQYARQQAFRKRVIEGGERVVSQKGFEDAERFAADIVKHLLTQLITGDLITLLRPELSLQSPASPAEQRPAIVAAVERLAEDEDLDLLELAKNPKNVNLVDLESKLRARAEAQALQGQAALRTSAQYWRHIGALAFLHDTQKALVAYQKAVTLDPLEPAGWRHLGELQFRLGNLHEAEQMQRKALKLSEELGSKYGMAVAFCNLGNICQTHGDLSEAEQMHRNALLLQEDLGDKDGMAASYGNLGNIYQTQGDLDQAEEVQRKALILFEELGSKQGMASSYGNLGIMRAARGHLDQAEEMQCKALKLNEELGNKDGMAAAQGNLGITYESRGNLDDAEDMQRRTFALYEELGNKVGMARAYVNLGNIYLARGDLDKAEEMQRKALKFNEELGRKEGMVYAQFNLGVIYNKRNDKAAMCKCWRKACDLYREMQLPDKVAEVEKLLKLNECSDS